MSNEHLRDMFARKTKAQLVNDNIESMDERDSARAGAREWETKFDEEQAARELAEFQRDEQKKLAEMFGDRSRKLAKAVLEGNIAHHEAQRASNKQTALSYAAWSFATEHKDDDARPKAETWSFSRVSDDS